MKVRSVLLTGASGGLGRSLALAYAAPGISLALAGRDGPRLDAVAEGCRALGARTTTTLLDVRDAHATAAWVTQADAAAPLDLVIANAGASAGIDEDIGDFSPTRALIETNLGGALNTIVPAVERMRARRRGHVVLIGSLAALRGIPGSQGYSASKAALHALAQGLRPLLAEEGIGTSLVVPGFVRTPMNEGKGFPTPFRVEPDRAAAIIRRGVERGRFRIAFPWPVVLGAHLLALVPPLADALGMRAVRQARARSD